VPVAVEGVHHSFGETHVLAGVSLGLEAGSHAAIMGPSGAGKSTLLGLIGGLERLQSGSIAVGDKQLERLAGRELARYRRDVVGFVFQHFGLLDGLSALENVELAMALARVPGGQRAERAHRLLDLVGLGERAGNRPEQLSGGERQRVAIARALANRPRLLLADEPTGNLDEDTAAQVLDLLDAVRRDQGCTLIVVTHNPEVAARAGVQLRLRRGRLLLTS
jgi:putative ABC transport system ATP-binding protein